MESVLDFWYLPILSIQEEFSCLNEQMQLGMPFA
jgi:hypothetical protein